MTNLSVARIIASEQKPSGTVVFTIRTYDENCIDMTLALSFVGSPTAARYSAAMFTRLCNACGLDHNINDTEELHNIKFIVDYTGDKVVGFIPLQVEKPVLLSRKQVFYAGWEAGAYGNRDHITAKKAWKRHKKGLNNG